MKFVKQFLILILALVSIVLIVALFVASDFEVSRSVEIEKERAEVFDYVRYLENHENFSVWSAIDPNIQQSYVGSEGNVGSIYKWNSEHEDVIFYELRFKKPWESTAQASLNLKKISSTSTKVVWSFQGNMPWPWNITLLFMDMDSELGPDLEKGLENLKNILEVED